MTGWTARALARQIGLPPSTVASWVVTDLISAEYGRGRNGHLIGITGLLELLAVVELRQAGFPLQSIKRTVENLRRMSGQDRPLACLTLVVSGKDIAWRDSRELSEATISALHQPGQRLMVFPIGERHSELLHQLGQADGAAVDCSLAESEDILSHVS